MCSHDLVEVEIYAFRRSAQLLGVTLSSLTGAEDDCDVQEQPELDFSM
jgi:DNA polymerase IV